MEIITKEIIREREGREMMYRFITFDFIFLPTENDHHVLRQVKEHLRRAFMFPFPRGGKSVSDSNGLFVETRQYTGEDRQLILELAQAANYAGQKSRQHEIVGRHFIENDPCTIAVEAPVWSEDKVGSMDILRYKPTTQRIQILDFKPNAKAEKHVSGQLFNYGKTAAKNMALPISNFDLIYFDDQDVFEVVL